MGYELNNNNHIAGKKCSLNGFVTFEPTNKLKLKLLQAKLHNKEYFYEANTDLR